MIKTSPKHTTKCSLSPLHTVLTSLITALPLAGGCNEAAVEDPEINLPLVPPSPTDEPAPEPQLPQGTSIFLAIQEPSGRPIPRALVTIPLPSLPDGGVGVIAFDTLNHLQQPLRMSSEGIEYRADSAGHLLLEDLQQLFGDRLVLRVEAPGYAPASVVLEEVHEGSNMGSRVTLQPVAVTRLFDTRNGLDLEHEGIRVAIPRDGVVDRDGNPVDGLVELQIASLDAAERLDEHPGPLVADNSQGQRVSLETYAMAEVSLWQDGRPLQLAPGAHATLELPLPEIWLADPDAARRPRPGDTIPAWWFDLDAGLWREEGVGVVRADPSNPDRLFWTADVAHFTWWNADAPWTQHSCFLITVHKGGVPLQGVTVTAVGKSYQGTSQPVVTDDQGQACTAIMLGGVATIYLGDLQEPLVPPFDVEGKHGPAACNGNGDTCKGHTVDLGGDDKDTCAPGSYVPCPYSGPPGTEGVGICQAGYNYCGLTFEWLGCEGEQLPLPEDPESEEDLDCNGDAHNGESTCAIPGDVKECYEGDPGTLKVGICASGFKECELDQNNDLLWSECKGQVVPDKQADDCLDPEIDSNCDGSPSCGYAEWGHATTTSPGDVSLGAVAVASDGTIAVTGQFLGQLELAGQQLNNPTELPHTLLARFLPDGTLTHLVSLGAGLAGEHELIARGTDHLYLSATLQGTFTVDACEASGDEDGDVTILHLNQPNLQCTKIVQFGGPSPQIPSALAARSDLILAAGRYRGMLADLESPVNEDETFLLTLDLDLNLQKTESFASNWGLAEPSSPVLAANSAGYALAFMFAGLTTIDGKHHVSGQDGSLLLIHRNAMGETEWTATPGAYQDFRPQTGIGIGMTTSGRVNIAFPSATHPDHLVLQQWANGEDYVWSSGELERRVPAPQRGGSPLFVAANDEIALHTQLATNPLESSISRWSNHGQVLWEQLYIGQGQGATTTEAAAVAFSPDNYQRLIITGYTDAPQLALPDTLTILSDGDVGDGYIARLDP